MFFHYLQQRKKAPLEHKLRQGFFGHSTSGDGAKSGYFFICSDKKPHQN